MSVKTCSQISAFFRNWVPRRNAQVYYCFTLHRLHNIPYSRESHTGQADHFFLEIRLSSAAKLSVRNTSSADMEIK